MNVFDSRGRGEGGGKNNIIPGGTSSQDVYLVEKEC